MSKSQASPGAKQPVTFIQQYNEAAEELISFLGGLGKDKSGGGLLGGLFGKAAAPQKKSDLFTLAQDAPEIGPNHAATAANHHLEGIKLAIRNYLVYGRDGQSGLKSLVMDITDRRNPLLMYGGPLPERPDGLFVMAGQSNTPPAANGREALYNDVQTMIRMAEICEQDFEDKRRSGKGYHTEHGYSRISYLKWLNSYIEKRKNGQSHDQSLPIRLEARNFRKIGEPKKQPKNTP